MTKKEKSFPVPEGGARPWSRGKVVPTGDTYAPGPSPFPGYPRSTNYGPYQLPRLNTQPSLHHYLNSRLGLKTAGLVIPP